MMLLQFAVFASLIVFGITSRERKFFTFFFKSTTPKRGCPKVIRRAAWEAEEAEYIIKPTVLPDLVVVHTAKYRGSCYNKETCSAVMRHLQYIDLNKKYNNDIIYNFCIGTDGRIYEGRGWGRVGQHAKKFNNRSIGFCIIGDPEKLQTPSELVIQKFLECSMKRHFLATNYSVIAHKQIADVKCPGDNISKKLTFWEKFNPFIFFRQSELENEY